MKNLLSAPLLIANRGEIAIRIARTARMLGIPTVALYSEADQDSEVVSYCDQAYLIGPASSQQSYLKIEKIIEIAKKSGAKWIHPGFGFLSERAEFARACSAHQIRFVGPSEDSILKMGDKITARRVASDFGLKGVPGSLGALKDSHDALKWAEKIGYPVLLKATAGGGGKGMRRVDRPEDLQRAFEGASNEALKSFGDGSLYLEKYILNPHHIEVQIFGDGRGRAVHLGERECSIQRRHQKVFEESPSPLYKDKKHLRDELCVAAQNLASSLNYEGAGTVEMVADENGEYYFLEMNTRLQVEHPVTEWVSGVDLVSWQLLQAAGELELPHSVSLNGYSQEVRIYAEDPFEFLPAPGKFSKIRIPAGPFVRWDSAYHLAGEVPIFYDPMIAKLNTWGQTRLEALGRLRTALSEIQIHPETDRHSKLKSGLKTNLEFLRRLLIHPELISGHTSTHFIEKNREYFLKNLNQTEDSSEIAAFIGAKMQSTFSAESHSNLKVSNFWKKMP